MEHREPAGIRTVPRARGRAPVEIARDPRIRPAEITVDDDHPYHPLRHPVRHGLRAGPLPELPTTASPGAARAARA